MDKKFSILLIAFLLTANMANAVHMGLTSPSDFTGDHIIGAPTMMDENGNVINKNHIDSNSKEVKQEGTMPPIKKLRLKYRDKYKRFFTDNTAPEVELLRDDSVDEMENENSEDIQQADDNKKFNWFKKKQKVDEQEVADENEVEVSDKKIEVKKDAVKLKDRLVLNCDVMDYDTENAVLYAKGNVSLELPEQKVTLYAEDIEFDKVANIIKANNKVLIKKGDMEVVGDYIVIDLNEENALLERPITAYNSMEINSKNASIREGVISQEDGFILFKKSSPFHFRTGRRGPRLERMLTKRDNTLNDDLENGRYKVKTTKLVIDSEKEHDTFLVQKATIYKDGEKKITLPRMKFYTNKNHDYAEGDFFEIGSKREAGIYAGPGVVFKMPKGSALKAVPFVSYKDELGYGGLLRFNSGTNETYLIYGSQRDKFIGRGTQDLDDNLRIDYATNDYINEWFMGRARPKYGISLVYDKTYQNKDFLGPKRDLQFRHRVSGGYYKDIEKDRYYRGLKGNGEETARFKYMAETRQTAWNIIDRDELTCLRLELVGQVSAAVYGTGDTQVIGRVGPMLHSQYKRWMQDVGYFQSAFQDDTPMPVYDAYRYGKSNAYLRETVKITDNFALSWFGSITLSNDSYTNKTFRECSFYATLGPEELHLNIGYDFIRENIYFSVAAALDPKGTEITYDKLEIKNADKLGAKKDKEPKQTPVYSKPRKTPILRNAVVEELT